MPGSILENIHDQITPSPTHMAQATHIAPIRDTLKDGKTTVTLYPVRITGTSSDQHSKQSQTVSEITTTRMVTAAPYSGDTKSGHEHENDNPVPDQLVRFLYAQFSEEILRGSTYPMETPMSLDQFQGYWFGTFAVVVIKDSDSGDEVRPLHEGRDWENDCLGTFYIKPNYPGALPGFIPFPILIEE
jgi:hypothetical protein